MKSRNSLQYEISILTSTLIQEAGFKRLLKHNPNILEHCRNSEGDFELAYRKLVLVQKEFMKSQLDKERIRIEELEEHLETLRNEILRLTKANEALFSENYDLLKYKFLYE